MICETCKTELPEHAVACWRCGSAMNRNRTNKRPLVTGDGLGSALVFIVIAAIAVAAIVVYYKTQTAKHEVTIQAK